MPYISGLPEYNVSWEHRNEGSLPCLRVYRTPPLPSPPIFVTFVNEFYWICIVTLGCECISNRIDNFSMNSNRRGRPVPFYWIRKRSHNTGCASFIDSTRLMRTCSSSSITIASSFSLVQSWLLDILGKVLDERTWTVPGRDSACKDFPASGPTKGSRRRNRCSNRTIRPPAQRRLLARTTICISIPTVPNTSSSSRDSTAGRRACRKICRPRYRPPRRRTGLWGRRAGHRGPPRSGAYLRTGLLDPLPGPRNTCTTWLWLYRMNRSGIR